MKLKEIDIPKYSLGEELLNSISHGIGSLLAIAALVLTVTFSDIHHNVWGVVSCSIYGSSLIILYLMSTIYHALKVNKGKKVFRVLDHSSLFIFIAGTYTPYTLVTLNGRVGWTLFGIIWTAAIIGIILNSINMKKYKTLSLFLYLIMGWAVIFAFKPLSNNLDPMGLWLLIAGGISYTFGALLYAIGKKKKYIHGLFHLFVLLGSILHFFSILLYVI